MTSYAEAHNDPHGLGLAGEAGVTKTSVLAAAVEAHLEAHDTAPDLSFVAVGRSDHGRLSLDGRSIARREAGMRPGPEED
jgi:hypothetical protein